MTEGPLSKPAPIKDRMTLRLMKQAAKDNPADFIQELMDSHEYFRKALIESHEERGESLDRQEAYEAASRLDDEPRLGKQYTRCQMCLCRDSWPTSQCARQGREKCGGNLFCWQHARMWKSRRRLNV